MFVRNELPNLTAACLISLPLESSDLSEFLGMLITKSTSSSLITDSAFRSLGDSSCHGSAVAAIP